MTVPEASQERSRVRPGDRSLPYVLTVPPTHAARLHSLEKWDGKRTSRFRGVWFRDHRWHPAISGVGIRGRPTLGSFRDEVVAAFAYDLALITLGHSPVNFPAPFYAAHAAPLRALHCDVARRLSRPQPPPLNEALS